MEDNSVMVESLVLSSLFQDLTLVNDYPLNDEHFDNDKCKFFFQLAKGLSEYKELTEATVASWIGQNKTLGSAYEKYGGYKSIENVKKLGDSINFDKYVDDLFKQCFVKSLKEKGFNVDKKVKIEGNEIRPSELFGEMTAEQVYNFYELLLSDASVNTNSSDVVIEDLFYTDEQLKRKMEGEEDLSTPFDTTLTYTDLNGNDKYYKPLKLFNDAIDGITCKQGIYFFAGSSGSAKSTLTLNVIMGLIESGKKVILASNEMLSSYFKDMLISYVCSVVFKVYSIDRKKIKHANFTKEEYEVFLKANEFIKQKYNGKLKFISVIDFNVAKITKIAKKLNLSEGYDTLILETYKAEDGVDDTVRNMVDNSRALDKFGKQTGMTIILPAQTRTQDEGVISYLTSASLAGSKAIKEVAHTITILRKMTKDECDKSNTKMYIKPFRWAINEDTGKYYKRYLEFKDKSIADEQPIRRRRGSDDVSSLYDDTLDINSTYRIMFIDKCRSSDDSGKVLLMKLDGSHGICSFVAYCDHIYEGRLKGY